jgi:hypothetical protein
VCPSGYFSEKNNTSESLSGHMENYFCNLNNQQMNKLLSLFAVAVMLASCNNEANDNKTDQQKATDTGNIIDKGQQKMNDVIDTIQSKGGKLIEAAGDTLTNKVIEPVKKEAKKVGEKIKEGVKEAKEQVKQ